MDYRNHFTNRAIKAIEFASLWDAFLKEKF